MRMLPITNRAADYAPIAPACCQACRVCTTQGIIGVIFAAATGIAAFVAQRVPRFAVKRS